MKEQRTYKVADVDLDRLVQSLSEWYRLHGLEAHVIGESGTEVVLQVRQPEAWRAVLGVSSVLNVTLVQKADELQVSIRPGRWVDKAIAGPGGLFLLWALLFTEAYCMWQRRRLPERTFHFIEWFLATGGADVSPGTEKEHALSDEGVVFTPSWWTEEAVSPEYEEKIYKFCDQCGSKLPPKARFCPYCGQRIALRS